MSPIRIAHLSDTHLGYRAYYKTDPATGRNQRAVDIERAYELAVSDILTRDVDLVVHSGDVFHHARPAYSAMRAFVRQTRRLEQAKLPVVVIGGNHDTPRLRTSGSVFSVLDLALPDITFVTGYEQVPLPYPHLNLEITAVPHGKLVDPIPPTIIPVSGSLNVLITHGLVPGMSVKGHRREPGEEEIADSLLDADFDYIALGHYHEPDHPRRNAWYSGSTERIGWGDEPVEPGYNLVELAAPGEAPIVTHIPLEARPMRTLPPVDGEGRDGRAIADLVLARLAELALPDALVRVQIVNAQRPIRREAESILRRESHDFVWWLHVYSPADILAGFSDRRSEAAPTDVRALFDEFVGERAYDQDFAVAFAERGRRALDQAIREAETVGSTEDTAA
ncbi:MAG: repair protein SbcD/Mre11 [Thermomicrobiales bacterium]|nr:repair protein SbcD/Mre11 [Thermomicrobiales bacterium]